MKWKRQTEEQSGDYSFSGKIYLTSGISEAIPMEEIHALILDLRSTILESGNLDYLQVYVHEETKEKIYWIDNISESRKQADHLTPMQIEDYDYSTILFPHEY
jgi:hypothetical protein